jgi:hypothetical protein
VGGKMRTEAIILFEGFNALREKLNIVETEKFISLIAREKFDYTEWQRNLWDNKSVDDIFYAAKAYREKMEKPLLQGNHEKSKHLIRQTANNVESPILRRKLHI